MTEAVQGNSQHLSGSVAIVAMGASSATYLALAVAMGNRRRVADEIWGINSVGGIIAYDRLFLMDDIKEKLVPLAEKDSESMPGGLLQWLPEHKGPIYTSTVYPEWPGLVEYPLRDVIQSVGCPYLNSSVAFAVALAIHENISAIGLYGCDFTYPDRHIAEAGRACVEFLLGIAGSRGIKVSVASNSTLMNANLVPGDRFYGYKDQIEVTRDEDDQVKIKRIPRGADNGEVVEQEIVDEPEVPSRMVEPCESKC